METLYGANAKLCNMVLKNSSNISSIVFRKLLLKAKTFLFFYHEKVLCQKQLVELICFGRVFIDYQHFMHWYVAHDKLAQKFVIFASHIYKPFEVVKLLQCQMYASLFP